MRIPVSVIGLACVVACGGNSGSTPQSSETFESIGVIERFEPEFDRLVPASARIEKLAEGFSWSEGPVWVPSGAYLLFSDIPRNVVFRWKEGEGLSEFLRPSGYTGPSEPGREPGSNGLALDPRGRLVLCQHGDRRLVRLREDGTFEELVSSFEGKRFNSPNDLVFASRRTAGSGSCTARVTYFFRLTVSFRSALNAATRSCVSSDVSSTLRTRAVRFSPRCASNPTARA